MPMDLQSMDFEDWEAAFELKDEEDPILGQEEESPQGYAAKVPNTPHRKFYSVNGDGSIARLLRIRGKQPVPVEVKEFREKQAEIYMNEFVKEQRMMYRAWDINVEDLYLKGPHPQV